MALNIIIVYDFAYVNGGAAKVAITEAVALARSGYDVTFFAGVGPIDERMEKSGVKVICLEQTELKEQLGGVRIINGAIQGLWNSHAKKKFSKLLDSFSPEHTVVHFHGWSLALSPSLFSVTAKRRFKIAITLNDYEVNCPIRTYFNYKKGQVCKCSAMSKKCVITNCDKRSYIQKIYRVIRQELLLSLLRKNDVSLICLSNFNKSIIERDLRFVCKKYIVPNLIDIPPKMEISPEENSSYLFIGRLNPEKGVKLFCEAVTKAGVNGIVIGDGEQIKELIKAYPNVEFCGWLTPSQMIPYIKKARCYIMTSLCYEGAPLTVPEIQCAYGMPCIVPTPCGAQEYVEHGKTGFVYHSGDIEDLLRYIEISKDDSIISSIHENLKISSLRPEYSAQYHVNTLVKTYKCIINDNVLWT